MSMLLDKQKLIERKQSVIIARETEIENIKNQFENVLIGNMGITAISGEAGSGKTYLVESCGDFFYRNKANTIKHKFEQYGNNSSSLLFFILDNILKIILALPQSTFLMVKRNLKETLKHEQYTLVKLNSISAKVFDIKPNDLPIKNNEVKNIEAVYKFLKVTAVMLHPLVVFIDDFQWSDDLSIEFINELCKRKEINIHLIVALRSNECSDKLNNNFEEIIVTNNLGISDIKMLINNIFEGEFSDIEYLTKMVYTLSEGNAFYVSMMINQMIQRDMVVYSEGKKSYLIDYDKLKYLEVSNYMEEILHNQICELTDKERNLFSILSCFGGKIDFSVLYKMLKDEETDIDLMIDTLCENAFIIMENNGDVRFVHDILHRLIYQIQSEEERKELNCDVVNRIYLNFDEDFLNEHYDTISRILLSSDRKILKNNNKAIWIKVLHKSALEARNKEAFSYALDLFELCEDLLDSNQSDLDIQLDYMQCEFISERREAAKKRYDQLCKIFSSQDDLLKIKLRYMYFYLFSANWEKVILQGKEIFKLLHFSFDEKWIAIDVIKSLFLYSEKNIKNIKRAKEITDTRILTILEILVIMLPAANRIDEKVFHLLCIKMANLSMKFGKSRYAAIGYAIYSHTLFCLLRNHKKGNMLQKITLEMLDEDISNMQKSIAYSFIGISTHHWTNSFEDTLNILCKSIEYGEKELEYLYMNYAIVFSIITQYVSGMRLDDIEGYIAQCKIKKNRLENYLTKHMYNVYTSHIFYLKHKNETYKAKLEKGKTAFFETIDLNAKMIRVHSLYLEFKYLEAYHLAKEKEEMVWRTEGFVLNGDFDFYNLLSRIAIYEELSGKEKSKNLKTIKKLLKKLKKRSEGYFESHMPRYLLAKAEYESKIKNKDCDKLYYTAMDIYHKNKNIQMEGLSYLLLAKYYQKNNKRLSEIIAKEASLLYKAWGADYISALISEKMGVPMVDLKEEKKIPTDRIEDKKEYSTPHIKSLSNLSQKNAWLYCLKYLKKQYGCQYSAILLEKNGEFFIKYEQRDDNAIEHKEIININYMTSLPVNAIRYAGRTEDVLYIKDNTHSDIFRDLHMDEVSDTSFISIPIKQMKVLIGILYFEIENQKNISNSDEKEIIDLFNFVATKHEFEFLNSDKVEIAITKREREILKLVAQGLSNTEISDSLFISNGTVRNYISGIYTKLGVESRVQAVIKACALKIV